MTPRAHGRSPVPLLAAAGLAALAWTASAPRIARVVYNPSDSVPTGWYRIAPVDAAARPLAAGDVVLVRLPPAAKQLAAQRGYLPANVPLLKRVGAVPPQHVCIRGDDVRIDGVPVAVALRADGWQRALPQWRPCRRLAAGELFLLGTAHPASFDSRYFGPVTVADVLGKAYPLWPRTRP